MMWQLVIDVLYSEAKEWIDSCSAVPVRLPGMTDIARSATTYMRSVNSRHHGSKTPPAAAAFCSTASVNARQVECSCPSVRPSDFAPPNFRYWPTYKFWASVRGGLLNHMAGI